MAILGYSLNPGPETIAAGGVGYVASNTVATKSSEGVLQAATLAGTVRFNMTPASSFWVAAFHSKAYYFQFEDTPAIRLMTQTGVVAVEIRAYNEEQIAIFTRSSGVLTQKAISPVIAEPVDSLLRLDVRCEVAVSGVVEVYFQGNIICSWVGDVSDGGSYTEINSVIAYGRTFAYTTLGGSGGVYAALATSDDSRVYHVQQIGPNGAGSENDFTGGYTEVDDLTSVTPFDDVAYSSTVGDRLSVSVTNPLAKYASGYDVLLVTAGALARAGTGDPNAKVFISSGGIISSGAAKQVEPNTTALLHSAEINPATGLAWTYADLANIEIGVEVTL